MTKANDNTMTGLSAKDKLDQLHEFMQRHELNHIQTRKLLAIAETPFKEWLRGNVDVPDPVSVAMTLYDAGEMPAPEVVANIDRTAVVKDIRDALGLSTREMAEATGFSLFSVRSWCRLTNAANIKPASLIAFAGRMKLRFGYVSPLIPSEAPVPADNDKRPATRVWRAANTLKAQSQTAFEYQAYELGLPVDAASDDNATYADPNTESAWKLWRKAIDWTLLSGGAAVAIQQAT
ncbi:MAG: hypothetical protein AWU57_595 [Marinobacter sp. T13-3]|nr:MAG: hypothetical protein AWU57_595 [Marinobacter sp. T13-3]